ncbi:MULTISPECIES: hypothetical protein [Lacticaseibacillus]|uniref:Uncharacterized protein n=2 Tax=Lacticaseibacillus TaxID=2759736 RepID=A0AAN1EXR8_LACCA|nr:MULTISPECIES: hypothetical protein [Lacticaseibacillus]ARY90342.1 hypothetical protein BGL52_00640 [Lacticaseibacillus casei]KAB1969913.1 hypothetical protein F9B82_05995 [Lacticaseibacillus casei]WLV80960.1 hypothetical protein LACSTY_000129 [Lacticaseibacillus sp. NCIMB 15473]WNX24919.1 hypothetical protein RWA15_00645 [Lacticaseibacillus casei]WNX27690.1 hypothetical protein RWA16_00645 [Lacticaseibacillus casei]
MVANAFTASQWQSAEQWNNGWLFFAIVVILLIVNIIVIIGVYVPNRLKWKWAVIVPFIFICLGLARYSWVRTTSAANVQFNQWAKQITPQIRVKKASFFRLVPVPDSAIEAYQGLNEYPAFKTLPMYAHRQVTAPVTYLGRNANSVYFKWQGMIYRYTGTTRSGDHAALIGYRFWLKDRNYTRLGFVNPSKTFTAALMIPKGQAKRIYHPVKQIVVTLESMDGDWTTEKVYRGS